MSKQTLTSQVKFERSHVSQKGNDCFVYSLVNPSADFLKAFKKAQGVHFKTDKDTKGPIWFSPRFIGDFGNILISYAKEANGKVQPDMSHFRKQASLAKQFGGNLGQEIAKLAAQSLMGMNPQEQSATPEQQETPDGKSL